MQIEAVIEHAILALYRNPELARRLFLKGGGALRLLEGLDARLSIDADFSLAGAVPDGKAFFEDIHAALNREFDKFDFDVIDFRHVRKPKRRGDHCPDWWGGWTCTFKLAATSTRGLPSDQRRRRALVPVGAKGSIIPLDISEHEYCGSGRITRVRGVNVHGYTRELLVLEKIRALCQQNPKYAYRTQKNRARDIFDIYELTKQVHDGFEAVCREQLRDVFEAKRVPLDYLNDLWTGEFTDSMIHGFPQVLETVGKSVRTYSVDVYLEHLRLLVMQVYPGCIPNEQ